jgi:arylsulfatase A
MSKNIHTAAISLFLLSSVYPGYSSSKIKETKKPNFIFILADNIGYGDLGCFGSKINRTPNIDNLAKEGMRLTSFYSSSPYCTPSRASLMTGCYAQRIDMHLDTNGASVLFPFSPKGLNYKEITIAQILKNKGYATECIGKWHLGDQPQTLPLNYGFDHFYGIPYSEDMVPSIHLAYRNLPLWQDKKVIEMPVDLTTTTKRYVREAIGFMTNNKNRPFFLYFAMHLPGSRAVPIVDDRFRGKSSNGAYGDAVEELDWTVGEIRSALNELGLSDNTIIVFSSDNGAFGSIKTPSEGKIKIPDNGSGIGSNEPFSGGIGTAMEGGFRVPCIVKWSGKIPADTLNNELCTMMDWLPTFAFLADGKVPGDRVIDGKNIWPLLSGYKNAKTPHNVFYYYVLTDLYAVREGKWKLHLTPHQKLIDLSLDFKEKNDLSLQYPEIVKILMNYAEKATYELGNGNIKGKELRPALYLKAPVSLQPGHIY